MLLWFVGTSVLSTWAVLHDSRFDFRVLVLGALLPDAVDVWFGGARALHSVTASVVLLALVMGLTVGRRRVRRRWLALPIGTFTHLVFDGAFADTRVFWWPFTGLHAADRRLPIAERWPVFDLILEAAGAVLCVLAVRRFHLGEPRRRRLLIATGSLSTAAVVDRPC